MRITGIGKEADELKVFAFDPTHRAPRSSENYDRSEAGTSLELNLPENY